MDVIEGMELESMDQLDHGSEEETSQVNDASSNHTTHIPEAKGQIKPKLNQEFDSLNDAQAFYNNYAKEAGFSVRSHSSKKIGGEITRKEFVCYKQGRRRKININVQRRRGLVREGCGAKMAVVRSKLGQGFVVSQFNEAHNHVLATPHKVHFLRSHRYVSNAKKQLALQFSAANVPTHQQISIMELHAGGLENIGCTQQDIYNAERDLRKKYDGHDAQMLYEYFQSKQEKNPAFIFKVKADDDKRITHCFWADATSRKAYQVFGDVVVFDTTCNTNRYSMIFAPFVGVNNHTQTTFFRCAFLSDETFESFVWLLKEWLDAMPGPPPRMIITDQDPAMSKAIAEVMPNAIHRYCIWHILNKFSEKINAINYKAHWEEFRSCIWDSETPEEFETKWTGLMKKSNLAGNEWLQVQYANHMRWVPAFVNNTFSAHMSSSQRAESCHSFFKKYVKKNNSLNDFVTRFNRALKRLRHNELELNHSDINENPICKTPSLMEKQMKELWQTMAYLIDVDSENQHLCIYSVQRAIGSKRVRKVVEEKSSGFVSCSCKKMESEGIPCRHILTYMSKKQIVKLPDIYIFRRWTKAAKSVTVEDDFCMGSKEAFDTSLVVRHNSLFSSASSVIDEAILTEETTEVLRESLAHAFGKIKSMLIAKGVVSTPTPTPLERMFNEPHKVRSKGCGRRLKGGKENRKGKAARRCNGCGLSGQSHDKRNCPMLNKIYSHGTKMAEEDDDDDDDDDDYDDDDTMDNYL